MNRHFARSLLLLGFCPFAVAAEGEAERIAKAKAEEIIQATLKGDFGKLCDLTYPKVIEQGGGRAKMLAFMKKETNELKVKGYEIRSATVGETSRVVAGGDKLFAVVPFTTEIKIPGGSLTQSSFVLGISADKGKTWTFINGEKAGEEKVQKMLPTLPPALKLPEKQKPVFKRDK